MSTEKVEATLKKVGCLYVCLKVYIICFVVSLVPIWGEKPAEEPLELYNLQAEDDMWWLQLAQIALSSSWHRLQSTAGELVESMPSEKFLARKIVMIEQVW